MFYGASVNSGGLGSRIPGHLAAMESLDVLGFLDALDDIEFLDALDALDILGAIYSRMSILHGFSRIR